MCRRTYLGSNNVRKVPYHYIDIGLDIVHMNMEGASTCY